MGHQHLLDAGHELLRGIGRRVHGSQSLHVEHYAGGDVVNDELPTAKFEAGHMAVWGPPVPAVWGGKTPVAKATA
ncbi:hypothetical protein LTR12_018392 [Friedmanniomyces endolithicus]|nr:hypothetical protein LTR12_018392 [Friedmanniomyces endolithicus]